MSESWSQWFRSNFNVLFLGALFLFVVAVTMHALHDKTDSSSINWLEGIAGQFMAALIGLMTGQRLKDPPPGTVSQTTTRTTVQEAPDSKENP